MGANMRCEKNSFAMLSNMRTKAFSKNRADEAFALPAFADVMPMLTADSSCRSGQELRLEKLKQTMLQHESTFKEQLYELHRLYQVQRLLMEESKRTSFTCHANSGSPSSNSSLLYNPDLGWPKEERRFWDINNASKIKPGKQLTFLTGQIDVNKPLENGPYGNQGANMSSQRDGHRPIIDLERPVEEQMEVEIDEKPFIFTSFCQPAGNPQVQHMSLPNVQCSFLSIKAATAAMHERKSSSVCTEVPSSSKWRSFEDCFTTEHSRQKEVPFFSVGSSTSVNCLVEDVNPSSSHTKPTTSLFGVDLNQEIHNRKVESPLAHNNDCERSTGQTSNLPHWLRPGLLETSAMKTSPINSAQQSQHQRSPIFLQKQGEKTASSCSQQERSHSQVKSGGCFPFGETFSSTPPCNASPGSFLNALAGHVQGYHKSGQASSMIGTTRLGLPPSIERQLGMPVPTINKLCSGPETDVTPALLFNDLHSTSKNSGSPVALPYQRRAPSPLAPHASKSGAQNQKLTNAFLVSPLTSWVNVPAHEEVQEGICTTSTRESGEGTSQGITGFPFTPRRPEAFSKRLVFGFMPTAADLDLTLGLDLNENGPSEEKKSEEAFFNESMAQRQDTICLQSDTIRNDFDLNEQLGQVIDAESHAISAGSKHDSGIHPRLGEGMSRGVSAACFDEWQISHHSSRLKIIPEETTASTAGTPRQSIAAHGDHPDGKQLRASRANGCSFVAGRSSDGSGLTSCESRSTPISALAKARDDSTLSGEACQSMAMRQLSQEMLFEDASMVAEKQYALFSAMSEFSQSDPTGEAKLPIQKCMSYKDDDSIAGHNQAIKHNKTEALEAADILLLLSLDLPSAVTEDGDQDRALKWLADIIPQDDMYGRIGCKTCLTGGENFQGSSDYHLQSLGIQEQVLDAFELSVLNLKPIDPDSETRYPQPSQICEVLEESVTPPNLRRRSLRRGRLGKDFQKETLPSIASLSRQEITEDLQILEGLVKSATEAMARCSLSSKEEVPWSLPALSSAKTPGKAKGFRSCKGGRQNGLLRVCSWGESTRRRRMQRQRRVCLPPGI